MLLHGSEVVPIAVSSAAKHAGVQERLSGARRPQHAAASKELMREASSSRRDSTGVTLVLVLISQFSIFLTLLILPLLSLA